MEYIKVQKKSSNVAWLNLEQIYCLFSEFFLIRTSVNESIIWLDVIRDMIFQLLMVTSDMKKLKATVLPCTCQRKAIRLNCTTATA